MVWWLYQVHVSTTLVVWEVSTTPPVVWGLYQVSTTPPVMWGLYQVSTTYEMKPPYEGLLLKLNLVVMCTLVLS